MPMEHQVLRLSPQSTNHYSATYANTKSLSYIHILQLLLVTLKI